jgi:hypothetical protein
MTVFHVEQMELGRVPGREPFGIVCSTWNADSP